MNLPRLHRISHHSIAFTWPVKISTQFPPSFYALWDWRDGIAEPGGWMVFWGCSVSLSGYGYNCSGYYFLMASTFFAPSLVPLVDIKTCRLCDRYFRLLPTLVLMVVCSVSNTYLFSASSSGCLHFSFRCVCTAFSTQGVKQESRNLVWRNLVWILVTCVILGSIFLSASGVLSNEKDVLSSASDWVSKITLATWQWLLACLLPDSCKAGPMHLMLSAFLHQTLCTV